MQCKVYAPSHITGFFEIIDHHNPLNMGSRGAGVSIDKGVITELKIDETSSSDDASIQVRINGDKDAKNASITFKTIELMIKEFKLEDTLNNTNIAVNHHLEVPIGAGFGTSAAFALGTALGTAKLLELPITFNKAASIAHLAEVNMKSGLGDVVAEINGGITIRLKEGAPGIALTDKIIDDDLYVIAKSVGGIETSEIIGDPDHKKRININGRNMLNELLKNPCPENFMKLSHGFAKETGLLCNEVSDIINILEEETMGSSMAMLGNTAFAISNTPDTTIKDAIISKIEPYGCRFI